MQRERKKPRLPRVERSDGIQIHEDENAHLWAVSYADFLMVLLSFFILFFSVSPETKNSVIQMIAKVTVDDSKASPGKGGAGTGGSGSEGGLGGVLFGVPKGTGSSSTDTTKREIAQINVLEKLKHDLENQRIKTQQVEESLVLLFPDDIYRKGSIIPERGFLAHFRSTINSIKPYANQIDLVFVGHTDSDPVVKSKTNAIQNNFDLSGMRANRALKAALYLGLPEESLSAKGTADNRRNSRTLSLTIKPRGIDP